MSTADVDPHKLWLETPLLYSSHISARLGCNAYLKLENLQPSQSFKYRGISYFIQDALRQHGPEVHLVIASGGNAGLAAACASKALGLRCTVYLPEGVGASTIQFMKREGAEIVTVGKFYLQALRKAEEVVKADPNAVMVPAYDEYLLWEGHGSMIPEISRQLPPGTKPDAIVCSVGGGGLAGGVMHGCKSIGWADVSFIAVETTGSNCFYQSLAVNPGVFPMTSTPPEGVRVEHDAAYDVKVAHLSTLSSRASSLGASSPAAGIVKMALERKGRIKSVCVPDEMTMQAAALFAGLCSIFSARLRPAHPRILIEEHKFLVELACSATLAPAYKPDLFNKLVPTSSTIPRTVVFIVCGGFKISPEEMEGYSRVVESEVKQGGSWKVLCNGEQWDVEKI
ncbi:tryptophan synthase beta subunit-like PLP-dependent enzyme [Laetiporus sulphureus 93-53]|uniref:L-serine ammonia-lyase n=1 Tax=Laetiporus sulphureus 93-53 TaxID=1314785 RepID=A0A165HB73_9APHY|nr:tryptophan synthase beta subunit-like PLP-dependent enzyme [Laetiporus sulphureus 93-53]KZT11495.1 tryptophan synthase beta subunit-like PLP-dependent enzyme [Laetiporus sulphureus 93-53]